ncbi:MAG: DUF3188 domain-containing protein [Vicingaceae bacterium]
MLILCSISFVLFFFSQQSSNFNLQSLNQ